MRTPLLAAAAMVAVSLGPSCSAKADEIRTFTLSGNYSVLGYTTGVSGTFTLDATTGTVLRINFYPIPSSDSPQAYPGNYIGLQTYDGTGSSPYALLAAQQQLPGIVISQDVYLPTNNLIHYGGGSVCSLAYVCPETLDGITYFVRSYAAFPQAEALNDGQFTLTSDVDESPTPEASTLALLTTGLLSTLAILRRKDRA